MSLESRNCDTVIIHIDIIDLLNGSNEREIDSSM